MARNKSASEVAFDRARLDYLDATDRAAAACDEMRKRLQKAEKTVAFELQQNSEAFERYSQFRRFALYLFGAHWIVTASLIVALMNQ